MIGLVAVALQEKGVDEVLVFCVNDGAVMQGWAKEQGVAGSMVTFLADTRCELTRALGMVLDHPGPMGALGNVRCKRFVLVIKDGVVAYVGVRYPLPPRPCARALCAPQRRCDSSALDWFSD